jgi:capsule polysaccharide export protein KpsE/RkpR
VENSGQRYAPVVDRPPEPPLRHPDDELLELEIDSVVSEKLAQIWKHRRILQKWVLCGVIISLTLWIIIPRQYDSTVRLMPPEMASSGTLFGLLSGSGSAATANPMLGLAASMLGGKTTGDLYIDVLMGPSVTDPIIRKFQLQKEYRAKYMEDARRELAGLTIVDTNRKSGVITITVRAKSPQMAQAMAQAYADQLDAVIRQVSNSSARRERIFLENRITVIKAELDDSSAKLAAFASKNVALDIPEQAKATLTAAARGQAELIAAQSELEGLRQIYTDNNTRVKALQARIAELRQQVDVQQKGEARPDSMMSWIKKLPLLGLQWAEYYRTATIDEAVYEALVKQYELAKVQEAKETTSVSVLDPASLPEKKAFPKGSVFLLAGLILSTLGGCSYIVGMDMYRRINPDHPAKIYVEETRARWISRWQNNRLRMKAANRRTDRPESNG